MVSAVARNPLYVGSELKGTAPRNSSIRSQAEETSSGGDYRQAALESEREGEVGSPSGRRAGGEG